MRSRRVLSLEDFKYETTAKLVMFLHSSLFYQHELQNNYTNNVLTQNYEEFQSIL